MKYCLLIFSAIIFVTACTKVDVPPSMQEQLREGKWKYQYGLKTYYDNTISIKRTDSVFLQECEKDDYLVFRENFSGAHNTGEEKCAGGENSENDFRWGIINNDKEMFIYDGESFFDQDVNAEIVKFDEGNLIIRYNHYDIDETVTTVDTTTFEVSLIKM